jgi:acetylornithine deacetylase/succinyl-diaminopimelate desuccinylase-like protein
MVPTKIYVLVAASLALTIPLSAQERVDDAMVAKIREEGLNRSRAVETFTYLTTNIGPRLTNSPAHRRAIEWTQEQLRSYGLSNVHADPFEFGRGWQLERLSIEMTEPRYLPLIGFPRGWTPSTMGRIEAAPVWLPNPTPDSIAEAGSSLRNAIVMTSPVQEYFIRADRPPASGDLVSDRPRGPRVTREQQAAIAKALKASGLAVTLEPNIGEHGTIFVTGRDAGEDAVPAIVLASEHYNLIARLLEQKVPVKLAIDLQTRFFEDDPNTANVIAEIPGTDPAIGQEVVMAGAHLDSWHSAVGATDNADGVTTVMEAVRILQALGVKPRRTIRVALWGGEEQGLLGSRAYVEKHLAGDANRAARDKFSVYFNLDNGFVPVSGFYMEGNEPAARLMAAWLKPLADLGATVVTPKGIGATDHLSFKAVGLPGFQAVQDYVGYDVRTHHTNMDTDERISPDALKQAAVVVATVLYHAAMRDERVPR